MPVRCEGFPKQDMCSLQVMPSGTRQDGCVVEMLSAPPMHNIYIYIYMYICTCVWQEFPVINFETEHNQCCSQLLKACICVSITMRCKARK